MGRWVRLNLVLNNFIVQWERKKILQILKNKIRIKKEAISRWNFPTEHSFLSLKKSKYLCKITYSYIYCIHLLFAVISNSQIPFQPE